MRIKKLIELFEPLKIDSMLVSDPVNVTYLTGFTGDSSYLWVTSDRATLLTDGRFETQIRDQCGSKLDVAVRPPQQKMHDLVSELYSATSFGERVGFEADHVSVATHAKWSEIAKLDWIATSGAIAGLRMVKDDDEINTIHRAVEIAEQSLLTIGYDAAMTERELAFALENEMRRRGASRTSFDPIVAVDAAGALPHYQPGTASLSDAATLLIDWGARVDGYTSDLTRTFHNGSPSAQFCDAYRAVQAAHDAGAAALRPGAIAADVDSAVRDVLDAAGLGKYFSHATGHGFGMNVHEAPRLGGGESTALAAGMVVTIEPGVYLPDQFGIRLENDFLITSEGAELISPVIPLGLETAAWIG